MIFDFNSNSFNIEGLLSQFKSISSNSKRLGLDCLFCALDNLANSGDFYILNAIENQAKGILLPRSTNFNFEKISKLRPEIIWVISDNILKDYVSVCRHFYKKLPKNIIAVTGTDGKTSVVDYFRQLVSAYGLAVSSIGTLGIYLNDKLVEKTNVTSLSLDQAMEQLNNFAKQEIDYIAMEASSHGLDQKRLDAIPVRFALFTNIHHDHLDYHKTYENYLSAKLRLFEDILTRDGFAIVANDFTKLDYLSKIAKEKNFKIITFDDKLMLSEAKINCKELEEQNLADVRLLDYKLLPTGISAKVHCLGDEISFEAPVFGFFQISNLMLVLPVLNLLKFDMKLISKILSRITSPKGRLEMIAKSNQGGAIFIDYSHTPNALKLALITLRQHFLTDNNQKTKIWLVFGCGGQRDTAKREIMSKVARDMADEVIITDDNPRFENASKIRQDILRHNKSAKNISPRHKAITDCLDQASKSDIILIAGKGHEEYQIIADQSYYYSDHKVVESYLKSSPIKKWNQA